jgi:hypothetical protein
MSLHPVEKPFSPVLTEVLQRSRLTARPAFPLRRPAVLQGRFKAHRAGTQTVLQIQTSPLAPTPTRLHIRKRPAKPANLGR